MKKIQSLILALALLAMSYSAGLHAEDIDIYMDNPAGGTVPNVLFVIDTGASFSANADSCTYASGGSPSLGNTAGGIEQCSLVNAIESLPDNAMNMGIMVTNTNGFATDVRSASDPAYHETCSGNAGGCLVRKLTLMSAANKVSLVNFIKSWRDAGQNSATEFNVKSSTTRTGGMMQEAWAYFHGKTGQSGTNYATSIIGSGCQKNFVIFIGNAFGNAGTPGDGTVSPYDDAHGLTSAQVGATAAQKIKISETVEFNPATCENKTSVPATTAQGDWSENWADEWARLMYQQDGGTGTMEGTQNIVTYTIGVLSPTNQCKADYPALLTTMAKYGGGKHFRTGNASEVTTALLTVLNEVQAVNSVFSSASLPVSVNAEGSYLNQIYLGMFRPDVSGSPRWMGNLKQYHLIKNASGKLVMGDAVGQPAISSAGTGFISPNAVSYWTQKVTTAAPDDAATGGFWKNDEKGVPLSPYDLPDGEVVEKGGVAQQLRLKSLTADFGATAGGASNPRRLYTYCPSGTGCVEALTDSSNEFSTANTGIAAAAFGTSTTVPIVSIVRTGTSALVTTNGSHGFSTGTVVTITNATQNDYNVTQAITVNSATTFTITGLTDFPTTPSAGTYTVSSVGTSPVAVTSIVRGTSTTGGLNSETATVTTSSPHGFTTTSTVVISGAGSLSGQVTPASVPSATVFTFPVTITPPATPVNTYQATVSPSAYPAKSVSLSKSNTNILGGSTSAAHGFWVGQMVTISGSSVASYNGTWEILTVPSTTSFTASASGLGNPAVSTGSVAPSAAPKTISLSRAATTAAATAKATGAPANFFGNAAGQTRVVNITKSSGSATNESAYVQSNVTITCGDATCSWFTYPITVTPAESATGTIVATLGGSVSVPIAAGNITRVGGTNTATVSGVTPSLFINGQSVVIAASGTPLASESAYVGTWQITCPIADCSSFTFGPVTQTPATPATGSNMQAYSSTSPPDRDTIIKWVRGADNYGDEKGPGGTITVRPSIHGDVLHSRPVVINYGTASKGIVVFYGSNDGVYRAINGNQPSATDTGATGSVVAGGEFWGLVLPEHFDQFNRQRLASPELRFPGTLLASAQPKDYFVDGPTGVYQKLAADNTIATAYIYLTMRRGGRFMYALDVSDPADPKVKWKIDTTMTGFEELGQTWSRPRVTVLQKDSASKTPVLIFGGGYDAAEDSQPPATNTMGRGIYIVNALTGTLIWSATKSCTTSATCLNVAGMKYAIPSDITFVDRDGNGFTDKLYFGDVGGNVWRADVKDNSTSNWTVTKLASLGCDAGACSDGSPPTTPRTTPRKFFFPPSVLTVKEGGTTGSYDVISIASGDREHPLKSTAAGSSYLVADKFFMIKDTGTTETPVTMNLTMANLEPNPSVYNDTLNGFYINFNRVTGQQGEKAVNAPLAVGGRIFFATNRPTDPTSTCAANLGEAKGYSIDPFRGTTTTNILAGGGLAPTAVTGLVTVTTTNPDGSQTDSVERFCIGCAADCTGSECSPLENSPPTITIPKQLKRTYWYKK